MNTTLLDTGLLCIVGAIVGGGLKALGSELPILNSTKRQVLLASFGVLLLIGSFIVGHPYTATHSDKKALLRELTENNSEIERLQNTLNAADKSASDMQRQIDQATELIGGIQAAIDRGDGTPELRAEWQASVRKHKSIQDKHRAALYEYSKTANQAREKLGHLKERNTEIAKELAQ